jgi:type II secretory pathway pseudopilin PulG
MPTSSVGSPTKKAIEPVKNGMKHPFTLLEMVAVIAILLITAAFVIPKIGRIPPYIVVDGASGRISALFMQAASQALAQGKEIQVTLVKNQLRIVDREKDKEEELAGHSFQRYLYEYAIPAEIVVTVLDPGEGEWEDGIVYQYDETFDEEKKADEDEDSTTRFVFHPDGSADGPSFELDLQGEKSRISISPLTGIVNSKRVEDDED